MEQPIGWMPGNSWIHQDKSISGSIGTEAVDGRYNIYWDKPNTTPDSADIATINQLVSRGLWIIQSKPQDPLVYNGGRDIEIPKEVTVVSILESNDKRLRYLEEPYLHYRDEMEKHNHK